ncbi:hypothetical protein KEM52_005148 [Ascosphaera acerosa]|nr:hypothetical protein KEM52_005148 [Ascosphaera acerosa]
MADYDSDASLSDIEDEAVGQTSVLLGFAEDEQLDDDISHLGGKPTWLDGATPPPGEFAKCDNCGSFMNLLLQLNGDLPDRFPNDARWLYIFGCVHAACNRKPGSIKAVRAVKKYKLAAASKAKAKGEQAEKAAEPQAGSAPAEPAKPAVGLGSSIFGGPTPAQVAGANPFAAPPAAATPANPFAPVPPTSSLAAKLPQKPDATTQDAGDDSVSEKLTATFAEKVRISTPSTESPAAKVKAGPSLPWPADSSFPAPYKHFYLDAEYETLDAPSQKEDYSGRIRTEAMEYEEDGKASGSGSGGDGKDSFESSLDKDFLRFSSRLGHNPEQVLRYEFNGTPLLSSTTDAVGKLFATSASTAATTTTTTRPARIPRCPHCGRERVFEVQLVPHAIAVLEEDRDLGLPGTSSESGMEWQTVIVGVCARNCGGHQVGAVEYRQEWAGVQWEEALKMKQ